MNKITQYIARSKQNLQGALPQVYEKKYYYAITAVFAILIYSFNAFVHNYKLLLKEFSFKLLFNLTVGLHGAMSIPSHVFLIVTAITGGILLAMSIFLIKRQITTGLYAGSGGLITSLLAPACPSCALGAVGILGIGGFLSFLPFRGLELGVLGIVIIVLTINYMAKKIMTNVCEIKK